MNRQQFNNRCCECCVCPPSNQATKSILGNHLDIDLNEINCCDPCSEISEIRADVSVKSYRAFRLWGQIKDLNNQPIPYALLKLTKLRSNGTIKCGIAHTVTDCQGYYQFDICDNPNAKYRILVSKANTGAELSMDNAGACDADDASYDPCQGCNDMDCCIE